METSDTKPVGNPQYVCSECGLAYKEEEWMKKCQSWCKEHKSCNLDIISHAEKEAEKKL